MPKKFETHGSQQVLFGGRTNHTMKRLKVDIEDIAICMDDQDRYDYEYYLDTDTGEVVHMSGELLRALDEGRSLEELPEEGEMVEQAKEILSGSDRYKEIPVWASKEAYHLMLEFTESIADSKLKGKVASTLHGKGAFRKFEETMTGYPEAEKEWYRFKADRDRERVKNWLEGIGIELEE